VLLYVTYTWLRRVRNGRLERDRQQACMLLLLTLFSLLYLAALVG
jgi:hypothetical protein